METIKTAPNHTLDYVAIRGHAKAVESTLKSGNVPSAKTLIQKLPLYEHKFEWVKSSIETLVSRTIEEIIFWAPGAN